VFNDGDDDLQTYFGDGFGDHQTWRGVEFGHGRHYGKLFDCET
jgi:hypothetical protein